MRNQASSYGDGTHPSVALVCECDCWQMSVLLEGVKMAEKITVDIVDGLEFELEVDGLYRWDPPACHTIQRGP